MVQDVACFFDFVSMQQAVPQKRKGPHLDSVTSPCPISDSLKCIQPQPIQPSSKMQPEKMKPQKALPFQLGHTEG